MAADDGNHANVTGVRLHDIFQYVASADPGAVGAGKNWLDITDVAHPIWKRRNDADAGWIIMVSGGTTTLTTEAVQDIVGALIVSGTYVTFTYDDAGNSATVDLNVEVLQDALATWLVQGTGVTIAYDDGAGTYTFATTITQYTDEMARDAIGAALVQGAGVTITVNDGLDTITIATTVTQYTDEMAQDAVGAALTDGTSIDFTYNDGAGTISAEVIDNTNTQKVVVAKAGADVGTRHKLNLIEGSNVSLTVSDNSGDDRVDVTIAASAGSTVTVATDAIFDTKGDLPVGTGADTASKLAAGSNDQVLTADSAQATGLKWATPKTVATDVIFDAKGDLPVGTGADTASKLAVGSNNQVLTADSTQATGVKWATPGAVTVATDAIWDTKGDLAVATGADAASKLAAGSNGQKLKADSAQTTGLAWVDDVYTANFVIDGGGSVITAGTKGFIVLDAAGTIQQVTMLADQSGSIVCDLYACSYANFDGGSTHPVAADKITASAPPTISASTKSQDSTLTGWTTAVTAGNVIAFVVTGTPASVTRVTVSLKIKKS